MVFLMPVSLLWDEMTSMSAMLGTDAEMDCGVNIALSLPVVVSG